MSHKIDTETLRCSCRAPMCFTCGWCSKMCVCPVKKQLDSTELELRKQQQEAAAEWTEPRFDDELERIRESDYDARAGTR